jgi:hypothetical protein
VTDKPKLIPVSCQACRLMSFSVTKDPRNGTITVACEACGAVLLTSQPPS